MHRFIKLVITLVFVATTFTLAGCGKNSTNSDASVRFLHVSPDSGSLGIRMNTEANNLTSGLTFEKLSTYQTVGSGTQQFKVKTPADVTQLDASFGLSPSTRYTMVIAGRASATTGLLLSESTPSSTAGNFRIRAANVAYALGSVDLYLLSGTNTILTTSPTLSGTSAGSSSTFVEVLKGDYRIALTPTGVKEEIYSSGVKTFADQAAVTVLAYTAGSSKLVNAAIMYPADDNTTSFPVNPYVRIKTVAAVPDVALVDLLVDGTPKFSNVPYKGASSYSTLNSGSRNLKVQATNVPGTYLANSDVPLSGGRDYTVANIGSAGKVSAVVLPDTNFVPGLGKARVRFVNAYLTTASLDVLVNFASQATKLVPNAASEYLELDANSLTSPYTFTFTTTGTTTAVLNVTDIVLDASSRYTVFIVGPAGSASHLITKDN